MHFAHGAEGGFRALLPNLAAEQFGDVVTAGRNRGAFAEWDLQLEAAQEFRIVNAFDASEMDDGLADMHAAGTNGDEPRRIAAVREPSLL